MNRFRLDALTPLTPELIQKYLDADMSNKARRQKLYDYYVGKHDILKRKIADETKPNNKIVNPYANYITDIMTGYFVGEPITYTSNEEELIGVIDAIFNYNDEAAENAELAKNASIMGAAFEIMYLDSDKQIRFKAVSPIGAIPIYENTIEEEMLYFIRYYDTVDIMTGKTKQTIEVYTRSEIITYCKDYAATGIRLISTVPHSWGLVPVIDYYNNPENLGDFEPVLTEIDAYDKLESNSLNDMDYFDDAYLVLTGVQGTTAEDIVNLKENRVFTLPDGASAQWLLKSQSDTLIENLKNRINDNIHKFSTCPAMTDAEFASNASGVAMKYKLMGLENTTAKKERSFKKGLQRRLELICNMLSVMGSNYDYRAIEIVFTRNIPANLVEMADVINKLGTVISDETKLSLLPIDTNYETEQERKQKESEAGYSIEFTEDVMDNGLLEETDITE